MFYSEKIAINKRSGRVVTATVAMLLTWMLVLRFANPLTSVKLANGLQDLMTLMLGIILESLPFIVLGIVLSVLVQVWLPDRFLMRRLPKHPGLRRVCVSFLGVFLPVCECGNVPLSRGLLVQGFSVGGALTFLLAAPILNPITIITTQQAFPNDPAILWARVIAGFAIANIIGWLYDRYKNPDSLLVPKFAVSCKHAAEHQHDETERGIVRKKIRSLHLFVNEANTIMPALFVGAFVAGLVQVVVPREILYEVGSHPFLAIGVMMLLAFVVSICSNVDAFFALAFSTSFTAGSIVSFLVFGPLIDIKMLNLMATTFKKKVLIQISILVALMSAITGLVIQYAF